MTNSLQKCQGCRDGEPLGFDFAMAFQPIVDIQSETVWGFEALVRGTNGEPAPSILSRVNEENRYRFDQAARVKAIETAGPLFAGENFRLSINFLPNAVYEPSACIRTSLAAAAKVGFAREQLMFEFTENEKMQDVKHVSNIVEAYKRFDFITAIDDFGEGYSGLNLLAALQPDLVKIDMNLIRNIDKDRVRRAIVNGIVTIARDLSMMVIAEGIETEAECSTLRDLGLRFFQGYLFAKPALRALPIVNYRLSQQAA